MKMKNKLILKKYWMPLLILVLLAIIVVAAKVLPKRQAVTNNPAQPSAAAKAPAPSMPQVVVVPVAQVPPGLPNNLPWEKGAVVLQNFTVKDPVTGKTQSTRVYVSAKTLDNNFTIYQNYLQQNGWTVVSSINQPTVKNLSAAKAGARLDITIAKDSKGRITVNVSYVD